MTLPAQFADRLKLPAVAAPMFLISGPDLVVETCRAGMIGTFPALNHRSTEGFVAWMQEIVERAPAASSAPWGVNLIVHKSNKRLDADLAEIKRAKTPLVITSLGAVPDLVKEVHSYGGVVFHDVIGRRHAEKAIEAGADGIVAVSAGAGGHAGTTNPFALVQEIRSFFDGTILMAGAINTGGQILAARAAGADLGYIGTRFIATRESMADEGYKRMLTETSSSDVVYTSRISGVNANFLRPSLVAAGLDPENLPDHGSMNLESEAKAWKTLWSAGHGVGGVRDVPGAGELVARLIAEYKAEARRLAGESFAA